MTAKYWGRGPRHWTIREIEFKTQAARPLLGSSSPEPPRLHDMDSNAKDFQPRSECHWTIHHEGDEYEALPDEPDNDPDKVYNIEDDESTWPTWDSEVNAKTFGETVSEGLTLNAFSRCPEQNIPFSVEALSNYRQKSARQRMEEEFGFAIMSRNVDLLNSLIGTHRLSFTDRQDRRKVLTEMKALHLAATYLDGSRQCCLILGALPPYIRQPENKHDRFGHTVLDNIFLTILRSHTKVAPSDISRSFQGLSRFAGEEVDICGRWDADSPCIRQLYAKGQSKIPFEWKHEFCHTSVQTVCHSITNFFLENNPLDIMMPSGLFRSVCEHCGHESSGSHFHALVMVAYHLAKDGTPNETIFGALACLVCLLSCGGNPFRKATLAVPGSQICDHRLMTPLELSQALSHSASTDRWPEAARTGWFVFVMTLRYITFQHDIPSEDIESDDFYAELRMWPGLGSLWGAIQTEFLTYRRLTDNDAALSTRFDMVRLLQELQADRGPGGIDWIEGTTMNRPDKYGHFSSTGNKYCPLVTEVCTEYVANVEQWGRIRFIDVPEGDY